MDKCCDFFKKLFHSASIDNFVFKLHYKLTFWILIVLTILTGCMQQFGTPIQCISSDIDQKTLNSYCWIHPTFTIAEAWEKDANSHDVLYPGVNKYNSSDTKIYVTYYQWVCFVLFGQALMFCIPRYFWKSMEKGRVDKLVMDLESYNIDESKKRFDIAILVNYFVSNVNNNQYYSLFYLLSEILNAVNVIGQMFLLDAFFGGQFLSFGVKILQYSDWDWSSRSRYDPMNKLFPRQTKCSFYRYGSSGFVQRNDALCQLLLNSLNEKIYVFLWFWLIILSVLSCLAVAMRVALMSSYKLRLKALTLKCSLVRKEHTERVVRTFKTGDWFLVYLLAKNLHPTHFNDFVFELSRKLQDKAQPVPLETCTNL